MRRCFSFVETKIRYFLASIKYEAMHSIVRGNEGITSSDNKAQIFDTGSDRKLAKYESYYHDL